MATNDFLTFAGDPAANVMTQAQYIAAGFTARLLGFSTGTALSIQLNKVWRQASLISHMIGQFTADEVNQDMLDDGTAAGMTALQTHFRAAVTHVAQASVTGFLPIAGGTLTGPLSINSVNALQINAPTSAYANFNMVRQAGQGAQIAAYTGANARWATAFANTDPEQGANTGSNFAISSFQDGGQFLDTPVTINRATSVVNFSKSPTVAGGLLPYLPIAGGTLTGQLGIGGQGHFFPGLGGNFNAHRTGFGWDGSFLIGAADGVYVGQIPTVAWTQSLVGAYLPIAGGTVTGTLTVNQGTYFGGNAGFGSTVYFAGLSDFSHFYGSARYRYRQWAGSWYDYWDGQTGYRGWVCNTVTGMSLDGAGNFNTSGYIHSNGGRVMSQWTGTPSVSAYNTTAGVCCGFWVDGSGMWLGNMDGSGNASASHMLIDNNGYITMQGSATISGSLFTSGGITAASLSFYANGSRGAIWGDGNSGAWRILGAYPNFQQLGVLTYGNILSYNTQTHPDGGGAWTCDINGATVQAGACYATAYPGPSDASLKTNVEPWTEGLDAVLHLNPVRFEFTEQSKLGPSGQKHFGVTAQDVEKVLPDAVVKMPRYMPEGVEEVLAVEASTIFYACVNAIKELSARLVATETRLQTLLEGGAHV